MLIYKQLVYLECYIKTLRIQLHSNYHVALPHHILTFHIFNHLFYYYYYISHFKYICFNKISLIHFKTPKITLIKIVAIFALLLYNDKKTDLKIKEESYGKKCSENHCKRQK